MKVQLYNVAIFLLLATFSSASSLLGASFGEPCGPDTDCDPRALLTCRNNSCECIKSEEMSYDQKKRRCVVLPGGDCYYSFREHLDCIPDATCNSIGICECATDRYENEEKLCIPRRPHGENCTEDKECQGDWLCVDGKCDCNPAETVFDTDKKKCAGISGTSCSERAFSPGGSYDTCMTGSRCRPAGVRGTYRCECQTGYAPTKNRVCVPNAFNQKCSEASSCIEPLICSYNANDQSRRCTCPFPEHQTYNSLTNECISLVDSPCLETVNGEVHSFPCVPNAVCTNSSGIHKCTCVDGWIGSTDRKCALTNGQPCSLSSTVGTGYYSNLKIWTHHCDKVAGLACRNGVCSCKKLEIYDDTLTKCRGMVGAVCEEKAGKENYCIDHAHCALYRGGSEKKGLCQCSLPYKPTSDRSKCSIPPTGPMMNVILHS